MSQDLRRETAVETPARHDALGAEHGWARGATMGSHLGDEGSRTGHHYPASGEAKGCTVPARCLRHDVVSPLYDLPALLAGAREERMRSGVT